MPASRRNYWSGRPDLNRRPPAPKAGALPGCATPRPIVRIDYTRLRNADAFQRADSAHHCAKTARRISLDHCCASIHRHFVRLTVNFLLRFSLHLQLHLRIPLEDLRVALAKQLRHPLVRHAARPQAGCIGGPQIVDPEVGDLGAAKRLGPDGFKSHLVSGLVRSLGNRNGAVPQSPADP